MTTIGVGALAVVPATLDTRSLELQTVRPFTELEVLAKRGLAASVKRSTTWANFALLSSHLEKILQEIYLNDVLHSGQIKHHLKQTPDR